MYILAILLAAFLLLLCSAIVLIIIKMVRTQSDYSLYFRAGTRLYDLAYKDDLTSLFNRNAYIRDLSKIERNKLKSLWFSIFDIDDFKIINDTKGHLYGDEVLVLAAKRLSEVFCEKNHTVYRIGGDEFLVISKDISEKDLIGLLLKLRKNERKNGEFRFSKGYAFVENRGHECFNVAFENADKMLYADKKSKKQKVYK